MKTKSIYSVAVLALLTRYSSSSVLNQEAVATEEQAAHEEDNSVFSFEALNDPANAVEPPQEPTSETATPTAIAIATTPGFTAVQVETSTPSSLSSNGDSNDILSFLESIGEPSDALNTKIDLGTRTPDIEHDLAKSVSKDHESISRKEIESITPRPLAVKENVLSVIPNGKDTTATSESTTSTAAIDTVVAKSAEPKLESVPEVSAQGLEETIRKHIEKFMQLKELKNDVKQPNPPAAPAPAPAPAPARAPVPAQIPTVVPIQDPLPVPAPEPAQSSELDPFNGSSDNEIGHEALKKVQDDLNREIQETLADGFEHLNLDKLKNTLKSIISYEDAQKSILSSPEKANLNSQRLLQPPVLAQNNQPVHPAPLPAPSQVVREPAPAPQIIQGPHHFPAVAPQTAPAQEPAPIIPIQGVPQAAFDQLQTPQLPAQQAQLAPYIRPAPIPSTGSLDDMPVTQGASVQTPAESVNQPVAVKAEFLPLQLNDTDQLVSLASLDEYEPTYADEEEDDEDSEGAEQEILRQAIKKKKKMKKAGSKAGIARPSKGRKRARKGKKSQQRRKKGKPSELAILEELKLDQQDVDVDGLDDFEKLQDNCSEEEEEEYSGLFDSQGLNDKGFKKLKKSQYQLERLKNIPEDALRVIFADDKRQAVDNVVYSPFLKKIAYEVTNADEDGIDELEEGSEAASQGILSDMISDKESARRRRRPNKQAVDEDSEAEAVPRPRSRHATVENPQRSGLKLSEMHRVPDILDNDGSEPDAYEKLGDKKVTFVFDKNKKRVGAKKYKGQDISQEFYEPERVIFGKLSIHDEVEDPELRIPSRGVFASDSKSSKQFSQREREKERERERERLFKAGGNSTERAEVVLVDSASASASGSRGASKMKDEDLQKYKKNPSLLFTETENKPARNKVIEFFDFTRSAALGQKEMLRSYSVVLVTVVLLGTLLPIVG
ncbi:hypothetical protein WICPIJ_002001 [Wickerhamomyces pijperi]|uniref:Uncharacterized protein n=1 Tax=Wickerhamomyces pijperi TaxID=599730 RepID=A0A9P8QCL3_WICPI|nr:hypothetical protein WICPIJ_002001 [Wickerhamomyces pijperi]